MDSDGAKDVDTRALDAMDSLGDALTGAMLGVSMAKLKTSQDQPAHEYLDRSLKAIHSSADRPKTLEMLTRERMTYGKPDE